MGYHRAGFDVVGVDIAPQKNYPFEFHQADALEYLAAHGCEFDAIHASPPCQRYSIGTQRWNPEDYPDMVADVRHLLDATWKPYVIENVTRAPLVKSRSVILCGTMFGLNVIRHRAFESNLLLFGNAYHPKHPPRGEFVTCAGHGGNGSNAYKVWCGAMGIDWMTKDELAQAIPPAYTEYIGRQLLETL